MYLRAECMVQVTVSIQPMTPARSALVRYGIYMLDNWKPDHGFFMFNCDFLADETGSTVQNLKTFYIWN